MNKALFDSKSAKVASVTEEQAGFYNSEPSALLPGTTVVIPAQIVHTRKVVSGTQVFDAVKTVLAYIIDAEGNLMDTKQISLSQFTRRSYGNEKDLMVKAMLNDAGVMRGEISPTESNITGARPNLKAEKIKFRKEDVLSLIWKDSLAYKVTKGERHNMAILTERPGQQIYDFETVSINNEDYLKFTTPRFPNLNSCAVPAGYAKLPTEAAEFSA